MQTTGRRTWIAVVAGVVLPVTPALAEAPVTQPPSHEPTAADVAGAPVPGDESGRLDSPGGDSLLRDIAQGVLIPPRVAVELVLAPPRATLWALDRYRVIDRLERLLFDDTMTYGVYPTVAVDSSYGATLGIRAVHRDVFGEQEHATFEALAFGAYYLRLEAAANTGTRLGDRAVLGFAGSVERRPKDAFYGIGNLDEDEAIKAHHRQELLRAWGSLDVRAVDSLHVIASGALSDYHYGFSTDFPSIQLVYDVMDLTGWRNYRNAYGELQLAWDSRAYPDHLDGHGTYDRGWLVLAYTGLVHQLTLGDDYARYGGDVQYHLGLGVGPRVLVARLHVDGVTGGYSDVAFTELPQLGGNKLLRGYPSDRFRDRLAVVGSLEYEWDLGRYLMASVFTDVGRVYGGIDELTLSGLRAGFGMSLQLHFRRKLVANVTFATSLEGGLEAFLEFDPVFSVVPRVVQR